MSVRTPLSPRQGTGWLEGWRLTFGGQHWEGALVTVVEVPPDDPGHATSRVFLSLYDLAAEDERSLDEWEGEAIGLYSKIRVRVRTREGSPLAWLYVLNDYEGGIPSAKYLGAIAEAAQAAGAPAEYIEELRNRPCVSNDERS
ncbi:hypothetical protein GALL_373960 [mine drainage metagenome]|uniref:AIG2-like family protein n=1 Tax=mine drainage metagenome TaxID=410659 RepID=A0A1J5QLN3_9ZZZZ